MRAGCDRTAHNVQNLISVSTIVLHSYWQGNEKVHSLVSTWYYVEYQGSYFSFA